MRVLLDVEGTLYDAHGVIPGAVEAVGTLRNRGVLTGFVSNKDSLGAVGVAALLRQHGFCVKDYEVTTPVDVLRRELEQDGARCHVLARQEVIDVLAPWLATEAAASVDMVVVGDTRGLLTWELLDTAFRLVAAHARLVALQPGRQYLSTDGPHIDTGAVTRCIEHAAGVTARIVGKPSPEFFLAALAQLEASGPVVVVGDDLDTDVAGARAIGARSVLVRTGKAGAHGPTLTGPHPNHVIASVAELPALLADW